MKNSGAGGDEDDEATRHKNKNPEMPLFRIKQQIPQQNSSLLDKVAEPHNKIANYTTKVAKSLNLRILQQNSPFWE